MAVQYDATYTSAGWYEIRERDATGRWIATQDPVELEP